MLTTHSHVAEDLSWMQLEVSCSAATGLSLRTPPRARVMCSQRVQPSKQGGLQLRLGTPAGCCWERALVSPRRHFLLATPVQRPMCRSTSAFLFLGPFQAQHKRCDRPELRLGRTPATKQGTGTAGIVTCSWRAFCKPSAGKAPKRSRCFLWCTAWN